MLQLLIGAGVLGVIIVVMEEGDFPGWFPLIVCVLAASLPAALINFFLPPGLFIVGLAVGAACAGLAISAFTGMSFQRASVAAGIYLAFSTLVSWGLSAMMST